MLLLIDMRILFCKGEVLVTIYETFLITAVLTFCDDGITFL